MLEEMIWEVDIRALGHRVRLYFAEKPEIKDILLLLDKQQYENVKAKIRVLQSATQNRVYCTPLTLYNYVLAVTIVGLIAGVIMMTRDT